MKHIHPLGRVDLPKLAQLTPRGIDGEVVKKEEKSPPITYTTTL